MLDHELGVQGLELHKSSSMPSLRGPTLPSLPCISSLDNGFPHRLYSTLKKVLLYPTDYFGYLRVSNNGTVVNMNAITYSQVHELLVKLPAAKLPFVYNLLLDLSKKESDNLSPQLNFLRLPLNERRRIMIQQANELISHYKQEERERQAWQAGDFMDEY